MTRRDALTLLISLFVTPTAVLAKKSDKETDQIYRLATGYLKKGRNFERAATLLKPLEDQRKNDFRIPAMIGCAYISRYASLSFAALVTYSLQNSRRNYPKVHARWEKEMQDPEKAEYMRDHEPKLFPDRLFYIKDDD